MTKPLFSAHKPFRLLGILAFLLTSAATLAAQQYNYRLTSVPDSARITLNGVDIGQCPMVAKIDWAKLPDSGFVFVFSKSGYEDGKYTVQEKPKVKDNYKEVKLEKVRPHFELDPNSALVNFDKLMTEFPLGKVIGHNKTFYGGDITWLAYSRVGVANFASKADDILGSAGFRTPFIKGNELFSSENTGDNSPRFLIGGKLTDIWVGLGPTLLVGIKAQNWCTIEWKVFDKVLNKVVLTSESRGEFDGKYVTPTELEVMMDLFRDALENFLMEGTLYELVKNAALTAPGDVVVDGAGNTGRNLSPVSIPKFEGAPEMIRYATQACVSVVADGKTFSGVMVSESGLIITTAHANPGSGTAKVVLSNGVELESKVLEVNAAAGLALMQVSGAKFKALPVGKGQAAGLGEEVVTIGTPKGLDLGQSVAKGIVSGRRAGDPYTLIETDMILSPGNGGGAVLDAAGRIIGILPHSPVQGEKAAMLPIESALKCLRISAL